MRVWAERAMELMGPPQTPPNWKSPTAASARRTTPLGLPTKRSSALASGVRAAAARAKAARVRVVVADMAGAPVSLFCGAGRAGAHPHTCHSGAGSGDHHPTEQWVWGGESEK